MTEFQVKPAGRFTGGVSVWRADDKRPKEESAFSFLSFFFFSSCSRTDAKGGGEIETNGTGGSKSPEFIHHVASGLTCRWGSVRLEDEAN